jgi:DNA-binding MarR family transcriptional regulator
MAARNPDHVLGFVVHEVARLLRRRFEQHSRAAGLGLTRMQCAVLIRLALQEGSNQAELAQALDIEPITLVRLLDRLEEAGFIERRPDPNDRRAYVLTLTEAARPMLERIYGLADKVYDEAQAGMSPAEATQLMKLLHKIKGNLSTKTGEVLAAAAVAAPVRRKRYV